MTDILPLAEEARAAEARAQLTGSLGALQARIAPKTLAQNAVRSIVDKGQAAARTGIDTAKKHPAAVAGAVAALGLFLARGPLSRVLGRHPAPPAPTRSIKQTSAARRNAE